MGPRWKLTVEGLGNIEHAEVDVRPLMLFVGENNSGKSYLATLLWGLFALQGELGPPPQGSTLKACEEWLAKKLIEHPNDKAFALTEDDRSLFFRLFDETLAATRQRFVNRVFNSEIVNISQMEFRNTLPARDVRVSLRQRTDADGVHVAVQGSHGYSGLGSSDRVSILLHLVNCLVFEALQDTFSSYADRQHRNRNPLFLPASRTGFMLLYKAVVNRQMKQLELSDLSAPRLSLTLPAIRLLNLLALGLTEKHGRYAEEAAFLEGSLKGRVELATAASGVGVNEYSYCPEGSDVRLDMSLSSSLVTELAPIILVLRHLGDFPVLILEEPEAHLHPKMQRHLAQVIVRLIRKGLYVWITTHSENFCQQINNFMKLGALEPSRRAEAQQKLGYGEQDYLELDDVTGYQFKLDETGERSTVTELKRTERGLVMPTFNKELVDLAKEIDFLDEQAEEE